MDDTPNNRNIALLIDADNASHEALDPVLTVLAELGTVNIRRAYGNWSKPGLKNWEPLTTQYGIEPQQQFDITKGKNATDMKMTIDAMDLLFRARVDGFGIMSSDGDFMPIAMRIRQDGLPVYGFGNERTPLGFQQACTRFIVVEALMATSKSTAAELAPPESSPPQSVKQDASAPSAKHKPVIAPQVIKLLADAIDAAKPNGLGYASLGEVGKIAGNRSSFDVRNYGFKRLSDLLGSIPNFEVKRLDSGSIYVRRIR
ncbi:MAG: NYN domain-containing protein [Sphingomonas sp.]